MWKIWYNYSLYISKVIYTYSWWTEVGKIDILMKIFWDILMKSHHALQCIRWFFSYRRTDSFPKKSLPPLVFIFLFWNDFSLFLKNIFHWKNINVLFSIFSVELKFMLFISLFGWYLYSTTTFTCSANFCWARRRFGCCFP